MGSNGEGSRIRLNVLSSEGLPLETSAPKPGDIAAGVAEHLGEFAFRADRATDSEQALVAAAWLALGDARSASHLLEERARAKGASPIVSLLYARAIEQAGDLPENRVIERERDAYETILKAWPTAWEALLGHADLDGQAPRRRRGAHRGAARNRQGQKPIPRARPHGHRVRGAHGVRRSPARRE